jgi:hypothetical protein
VALELVTKSREAALAAIQVFNNPLITFKSESFIVLMNVAWTYLLHAYYRQHDVEYRYFEKGVVRRRFLRTKHGAFKNWDLERCLNDEASPIDRDSANNLRFLIGIRHEIEHQMTSQIDDSLTAKFQACCYNYNRYVKELHGNSRGIDKYLALSLNLTPPPRAKKVGPGGARDYPPNLAAFQAQFEGSLSNEEYRSDRYAYRVFLVPKTANRKGQADEVIEFVKADSPHAEGLNKPYAAIKEVERPKHLPTGIVRALRLEGYPAFSVRAHTLLWKERGAKNPALGFGVEVLKTWYWYDCWVDEVRAYCREHASEFGDRDE